MLQEGSAMLKGCQLFIACFAAAAMRVLSLSQAEVAGTVVKACVENGQSVTPGQPLFIIKP
jgi:multidrug resistance efflux pump